MIEPSERLHAATLLANAARDFHARGWMWGTSGNLSTALSRDPLAFLITASGRDKGELTPADTLLVGAGGAALEEWHGKPSAEMPVHERIYTKFGAGAVFHVHTVMAGVLSDHFWPRRGLTLQGVEMLKGFGHAAPDVSLKIPIADNDADSNVIADLLEQVVQPGVPGVLIRNHGLYAWGDSPQQARNHLEVFEYLFQYAYHREVLKSR